MIAKPKRHRRPTRICFTAEISLRETVEQLAKEERRFLQDMYVILIEEALEQRRKGKQLTLP